MSKLCHGLAGTSVGLLFVCLVGPRVAEAACDVDECLELCREDCLRATTASPGWDCEHSCSQASCDNETACENRLGYRPTLHGGAHLAYGLGAGLVPNAVQSGFRHHLELAATLGPGKDRLSLGNGFTGSLAPTTGLLFGASGMLGLGSSPSYALVEGGYGQGLLAAIGGLVGAGLRFGEHRTAVVGLRVNADVLFLNLGVRFLTSFEEHPDLVALFLVGLGRY